MIIFLLAHLTSKRVQCQTAYFLERKGLDILIFKIFENFENLMTLLLMKELVTQLNKTLKIFFCMKDD